ncbi:hypothetical protein [Leeia oryzae]|uniref:hypothetical protein n=1 Tax=Leeia oryzae TaxID=356662 RepID=UPI0004777AD8|nr:hypothetical protein [Leeia oryzae]
MKKNKALFLIAAALSTTVMAGTSPITLVGVNVFMKPGTIFKNLKKAGYTCATEDVAEGVNGEKMYIKKDAVSCKSGQKEIFVSVSRDAETNDWKQTRYIDFKCESLNTCHPFSDHKYDYSATGAEAFLNDRLGTQVKIGSMEEARREQFCTTDASRSIACFDDSGRVMLQLDRP